MNETRLTYQLGLPKIQEDYEDNLVWSHEKTEEENFLSLELEQVRLLFTNPDYLEFLKKEKFDIGIGSLSFHDTLLFRELELPYIKITEDDIESYAM